MARLREGDRSAFEQLFLAYRDPVWRFFRRRVRDAERAEELSQETFLSLLSGASRFEGRGSCRSYLFGIAYNLLMDSRRRSRSFEPLDPDTHSTSPNPDTAIWVQGALLGLEPADREILMLREYEQLSYQEMADLLALPVNTVRSRLFRARAAMRDALVERTTEAPDHANG